MDVQINNVCQCCFAEGCEKEMYFEYERLDQTEIYGDMLLNTLGIEVANGYICELCILCLRDTIIFKNKVLETQQCIKTILESGSQTDAKVVVKKEDSNADYISDVVKIETFDDYMTDEDVLDEDILNYDGFGASEHDSSVPMYQIKKKVKSTKKIKERVEPRISSRWGMPLLERENVATLLINTTMRPFIYISFPIRYKCLYCSQLFNDVHLVLRHVDTHNVVDKKTLLQRVKGKQNVKVDICDLKCRICFAPFDDLDSVRGHLESVHEVAFTRAGNGIVAFKLNATNGLLNCHLCSKNFHSFFMLNRHISGHYSNFICDSCGKSFVSINRLIQHKSLHSNKSIPCTKCDKKFVNALQVKTHLRNVHLQPRRKSSKCTHCDERFQDHYKKLTHLRLVHDVTFNFKCECCEKDFRSRKALTLHTTQVHKRNIVCDICFKVFPEVTVLKRHMSMHSDAKDFRCPLCEKCYKYEKSLKSHVRSHNPDWTYVCSGCKIGFPNKNEYKKHVKMCDECREVKKDVT